LKEAGVRHLERITTNSAAGLFTESQERFGTQQSRCCIWGLQGVARVCCAVFAGSGIDDILWGSGSGYVEKMV